jgi:hypothetical protein
LRGCSTLERNLPKTRRCRARSFSGAGCEANHCRQFSISISNGERGLTVRFESEHEFRQFLECGQAEKR